MTHLDIRKSQLVTNAEDGSADGDEVCSERCRRRERVDLKQMRDKSDEVVTGLVEGTERSDVGPIGYFISSWGERLRPRY